MVGYSTLKSRVSFPNGGCGMALFPTVDIRPAVSTSKEPSQLALLTVDILSWRGQGVSVDPHWSTGPPLPDSCTQFCPNCTWPREGLEYIDWERWGGARFHWCRHGKAIVCIEWKLLGGGCLRVIHVPTGNPSPRGLLETHPCSYR